MLKAFRIHTIMLLYIVSTLAHTRFASANTTTPETYNIKVNECVISSHTRTVYINTAFLNLCRNYNMLNVTFLNCEPTTKS